MVDYILILHWYVLIYIWSGWCFYFTILMGRYYQALYSEKIVRNRKTSMTPFQHLLHLEFTIKSVHVARPQKKVSKMRPLFYRVFLVYCVFTPFHTCFSTIATSDKTRAVFKSFFYSYSLYYNIQPILYTGQPISYIT